MPDSASALLNRLLARGKFRHVQILLQLAELGSVQRTADAIGMTQSSVTQALAYLENLLEVPLFERHARGVRPTPSCKDLLPVARQLMMGIWESADIVVARQMQGHGTVRLIGSAASINGLLVGALAGFSDRFPGVQVQLRESESDDQLLAIARGEVDLVACRKPPVIPEGWEFHPVREDRLAIVCRVQHPLARRGKHSLADLAAHAWLLLPAGFAARARFDELVQKFPKPPPVYSVVTRSQPMMAWLLRNRDLLAYLPLTLARPLLDGGELIELQVGKRVAMQPIGILQPQGGMGEAASRLSEFLRAGASPAA
ncbi:LysR family transcriptional regulator [Ramlibacter sp. PS3R-8]|uniref:LysR family transcriptional regulator n=1 Tax=Ramlibacter sp. PS3R-8 TaxID=3133437 RepID=UPI0030AA77E4